MYGYFKLTNRFFEIENFHLKDLTFICKKYNLTYTKIDVSKNIVSIYKKAIQDYFGFSKYNITTQSILEEFALTQAKHLKKPIVIFELLITQCINLKCEVPSYTELSRIVTISITKNQREIYERIKQFKNDKAFSLMDELLKNDNQYLSRYKLTRFKKFNHWVLSYIEGKIPL